MFVVFKLGAHSRKLSSTVANDVVGQKFPLDEVKLVDEIEGIRHEYEEAKRSFLNIPIVLKEMPKMDPEGRSLCSSQSIVVLVFFCLNKKES